MRRRSIRRAAAVLAVAITASSCAPHSSADETFVAQMVPHHEVGLRLVEDGQVRSVDVRLRRLIFEMGSYHHAELHSLESLAEDWSVGADDDFPGNLREDDFVALAAADAASYDRAWIDLMLVHHRGAVLIAQAALRASRTETVRAIAASVVAVQSDEIVKMIRLRKALDVKSPAQ